MKEKINSTLPKSLRSIKDRLASLPIATRKFIFVSLILISVVTISLQTDITKPRLWIDEGKTVELARNFLNYRTLDIQIAPGQFSDIAPLQQSTGYPVSILLAGFFKLFGFGPHQARVYMILWIILTLLAVFYVSQKIFGAEKAILSFLLIASFASFYDSGRTVVGEIPGFFFLMIGLYHWLKKEEYWKLGLFWGLAVVTKPSVFILIIPSITLTLLEISNWPGFKDSITKLSKIALAMLPAAILWFLVVINGPLAPALSAITKFYKNPYSSNIGSNILQNIRSLPTSTTIIYFGGLFALIISARYLMERDDQSQNLYNFTIIYSIFAFIYYLRSPGWLRYILIAELLILFILPDVLIKLADHIKKIPSEKKILTVKILVCALVIIQTVQIFTIAKIYYSVDVPNIITYINDNFPNSSVATYQVIEASSFFNTEKRFNRLNLTGMPTIGNDPLAADIFPDLLVAYPGELNNPTDKKILASRYLPLNKIGYYEIYKLKSPIIEAF